jgi:hypothetical protein
MLVVSAALSFFHHGLVAAEDTFTRDFDGPDTAWQLMEAASKARILSHECTAGGARDQAGMERIVVSAAAGESAHIECATAQAAIIDELQVRLWLRHRCLELDLVRDWPCRAHRTPKLVQLPP